VALDEKVGEAFGWGCLDGTRFGGYFKVALLGVFLERHRGCLTTS
jgi:hypothetical protein